MDYRTLCCLASLCVLSFRGVSADDATTAQYDTYDQAIRAAVPFYRVENYSACLAPLEAAVELASNDQKRGDAYLMLINSYAEVGEPEKMCQAAEFAIQHSKSAPRLSVFLIHPDPQTTLARAAVRKGQVRFVRKRCQDRLEKEPHDIPSLVILAGLAEVVDRDPQSQVKYLQELSDAYKQQGTKLDASQLAKLAYAFKRTREFDKAAERFEQAAAQDAQQKSYFLSNAAKAWSEAGETEKSLAVAAQAIEAGPDDRNDQLSHFWHRNMGEVFLAAGKKPQAIEHLKKAMELTDIKGYKDQMQKLLDKAESLPD